MVPVLWIIGAAAIGAGTTYYNNKKNKEEDEYKRGQTEKNKEIKNSIETLPFFIATSYSMANIDGEISNEEQQIITKYKNNIIKLMPKDEEEKQRKILSEIENNKCYIKLSEAILYINEDYEKFAQKQIEESIKKIIWADGKKDDREEELLKRINIFIRNGRESIKEIKELENNDLLPNYYLTNNENFKTKISSTQLITPDSQKFNNIKELQNNNYYVVHPMNDNTLFDIKDIDNIETLIISEWHSLANKLGAKSFSCTVEIEESSTENNDQEINTNINSIYGSSGVEQNSSSLKNDYESKFTQFNYESKGAKCTQSKEELLNNMLWLKNNTLAVNLVDAMTSTNSHTKFEIESSLKKFNDSNKQFNLTAHLSLLEKIDSKLKVDIEKNITTKSHYKQKIIITF